MRRSIWQAVVCAVILTSCGQKEKGFELIEQLSEKRVDIFYDGHLFTSYAWPETMEKPILYPIYNAHGVDLTRGFPANPQPGERVDHPHHLGLWFNYGNVNRLDFWNNSYNIPEANKPRYGSILHKGITEKTNGAKQATLTAQSDWNDPTGKTLLKAETRYIFGAEKEMRTIEHIITLTAQADTVVFSDSKEGLLGIRMDKAFEEVSEAPVLRIGDDKLPMAERTVNNDGVNGLYRNSLGDEKESGTWGKRAGWASVSAEKEGDKTTVAILDHKENPGFPAHWHTRGYGLFAVNNLGSKSFHAETPAASLTLLPGESVTFRHKILIKTGSYAEDREIDTAFEEFNR
ncbi:hypothetical protein M2480_002662 [Parabacteroides sp. PFB2-12]|uniref:DUF6807 domain-containing protein n=1 Tax=unclassified Parabacteroides TaxID=2649774 RepID=UPI002474CCDB|nr:MULTISPECIES: PmoA family protein [unclassified Parabacteroides]MDH6343979.1 hypothetical protein [Parabacteroides sp. PM6-13]MDH6391660.1 hypothetical protein [Parabacteroides sp. PFB2-12]